MAVLFFTDQLPHIVEDKIPQATNNLRSPMLGVPVGFQSQGHRPGSFAESVLARYGPPGGLRVHLQIKAWRSIHPEFISVRLL